MEIDVVKGLFVFTGTFTGLLTINPKAHGYSIFRNPAQSPFLIVDEIGLQFRKEISVAYVCQNGIFSSHEVKMICSRSCSR